MKLHRETWALLRRFFFYLQKSRRVDNTHITAYNF